MDGQEKAFQPDDRAALGLLGTMTARLRACQGAGPGTSLATLGATWVLGGAGVLNGISSQLAFTKQHLHVIETILGKTRLAVRQVEVPKAGELRPKAERSYSHSVLPTMPALAPARLGATAVARPMPLVPPVTRTVRPSRQVRGGRSHDHIRRGNW